MVVVDMVVIISARFCTEGYGTGEVCRLTVILRPGSPGVLFFVGMVVVGGRCGSWTSEFGEVRDPASISSVWLMDQDRGSLHPHRASKDVNHCCQSFCSRKSSHSFGTAGELQRVTWLIRQRHVGAYA